MPADRIPTASAVRVRVPAKINLALRVGPARPDGFHDLVTVFQAVELHDEVTARPGTGLTLSVTGSADGVPEGPDNLAWRAAALLAERHHRPADVALTIRKAIPVAGGMAGGSADAAGALLACATLWELDVPREQLMELAAELGSDVPFGLMGGTALGTGRGELLTQVLATGSYRWLVAVSDQGIAAAKAYRRLDELRERSGRVVPPVDPTSVEGLLDALRTGDPHQLRAQLHNDLQEAAIDLLPALETTVGALDPAGMVSGSGPTCLFLLDPDDDAEAMTERLLAAGACTSAFVVTSPAPPARAQVWT